MGKDKGKEYKPGKAREDMRKWAKDKVDKGQKALEQQRDTGGKGQQKGK